MTQRDPTLHERVETLEKQVAAMRKLFFQDRKAGRGHSELRNAKMVAEWAHHYPARFDGEAADTTPPEPGGDT